MELLLAKGANYEHRNVSDYTPLSLAASGCYVNIDHQTITEGWGRYQFKVCVLCMLHDVRVYLVMGIFVTSIYLVMM